MAALRWIQHDILMHQKNKSLADFRYLLFVYRIEGALYVVLSKMNVVFFQQLELEGCHYAFCYFNSSTAIHLCIMNLWNTAICVISILIFQLLSCLADCCWLTIIIGKLWAILWHDLYYWQDFVNAFYKICTGMVCE